MGGGSGQEQYNLIYGHEYFFKIEKNQKLGEMNESLKISNKL